TPKPAKPSKIWSGCLREEGPAQKSALGRPGWGVGELDRSFGNGSSRSSLYQAQTLICAEAGACETGGEVKGSRNAPTKISPCAWVLCRVEIAISLAFVERWRAAPGSGLHRFWISCALSPRSNQLSYPLVPWRWPEPSPRQIDPLGERGADRAPPLVFQQMVSFWRALRA